MQFPLDSLNYHRRNTQEVAIGNIPLGGENPLRVQTMATATTCDVEAVVVQAQKAEAEGCDYFRITAPGVKDAACLGAIHRRLEQLSSKMPLVADIHFTPQAAYEALKHVEKVRINPGNFADRKSNPPLTEITEEAFMAGAHRVKELFSAFLQEAKERGRAIRLGVNHGSLSERMLLRYGDTPLGMVESCLEYLRVAQEVDFRDLVISMKSSNVQVMTQAVRLLVERMEEEHLHYPLHLGVTEAGEGEDGRIKSAIGIGSLLTDGLGDTLRVSLSEPPEAELPVARALVRHIEERSKAPFLESLSPIPYAPHTLPREASMEVAHLYGGGLVPSIFVLGESTISPILPTQEGDLLASSWSELLPEGLPFVLLDAEKISEQVIEAIHQNNEPPLLILRATGNNRVGLWRRAIALLVQEKIKSPIVLAARFAKEETEERVRIAAATDLGTLLLEGVGSAILLEAPHLSVSFLQRLALGILQATRLRFSHTEYISCPGCGRTLYNLQETIARIKSATHHLSNLKIGIMGCIVNGPGEMADADYGYVGGAPGKIDLYKGQKCVRRGIPQEEAVEALVALIKENGDWQESL